MLRIDNKWITSHYKKELYTARRTKPMEEYLKVKYNWNEQMLKDIHWPSIKTVQQQISHMKRMQMCKIVHGWLPVAHMHHHITGTNQCPGCKCYDKTIDHFLQCPHPSITEKRTNILKQMRAKGINWRYQKMSYTQLPKHSPPTLGRLKVTTINTIQQKKQRLNISKKLE